MKPASLRQQKIAEVYDGEIWPLLPGRAAALILRALPGRAQSVVFEAGCASGQLALAVAERLDEASRLLAIDGSPALIALADAAKIKHPAGSKVTFHVADAVPPLPVDDAAYDLALSNLAVGEASDPRATIGELHRCLKPGGRVLMTLPLQGSWAEFLDLYGDVLTEQGKREGLAALTAWKAAVPDAATAASWLDAAGFTQTSVEMERFELLFKSAREFFFAPVVERGPLPVWKQIAGRGDEMQDVFFFIKEAIETYFSRTVFPVTMVIGCLSGTKPSP